MITVQHVGGCRPPEESPAREGEWSPRQDPGRSLLVQQHLTQGPSDEALKTADEGFKGFVLSFLPLRLRMLVNVVVFSVCYKVAVSNSL